MLTARVLAAIALAPILALAGCDEDAPGPGDESGDASTLPPQPTRDASRDAGVRDAAVADANLRDAANTGMPDAATSVNDASTAGPDADAQQPAASGCAAHDYALCEDFESAATGALPTGWTVKGGGSSGAPMVVDAEHHGGTHALQSSVATNGQKRASKSLSSLGAIAGKHWGRVFYKVKTPAPLPAQGVIHNTIVGLQGSTEARVVDTVVNTQGKHQFLYNLPDDSCCSGSAYDYASYDGKWHCAEWYVDSTTQTFRFFFEGTEVKSIGFSNMMPSKSHIDSFSAVVLGWINYQTPSKPYESWLDDLAIDDQQIGCN